MSIPPIPLLPPSSGVTRSSSHRRVLGPLLFCLAIFQLQSQLKSELHRLYLDDVTLDGTMDEITDDPEVVLQEESDLGLSLNPCKSEIICTNDQASAYLLSLVSGAKSIHPSAVHLLEEHPLAIYFLSLILSARRPVL